MSDDKTQAAIEYVRQDGWPEPPAEVMYRLAAHGRRLANEVERLRALESLNRMAWRAIANDPALKCRCGVEPYTDGEPCPKCWAIAQATP